MPDSGLSQSTLRRAVRRIGAGLSSNDSESLSPGPSPKHLALALIDGGAREVLPGRAAQPLAAMRRNPMAKSIKIGRSAVSGRFMPVKKAQGSPKAVVETIKR